MRDLLGSANSGGVEGGGGSHPLASPRVTPRVSRLLPTLVASDRPVGDVSETRRRLPPIQWRRTTAIAPGSPFRRASRSAANGEMVASDAGPAMYPRSRSGD